MPTNKKLPRTELSFARQQLRAQKGVAARLRKENEKLRQELAKEKLKAPMNDVLLVIMRLCRNNYEGILELLDKRDVPDLNDKQVKQSVYGEGR